MERKILLSLSHKCLQELYNIMYSKRNTGQVFQRNSLNVKKKCSFKGHFPRCTMH